MSEEAIPLSVDVIHERADALHQQAATLDEAVTRAEHGEVVPVIAHGEHVADVVPSGEIDRLRETIEVLADSEGMRELAEAERSIAEGDVVVGREAIRALLDERK